MKLLDKLNKTIENIEEQNIDASIQTIVDKRLFLEYQIKKFHDRSINLQNFIEKVITKYNTIEYKNRYYKRNKEPREELFWFLYYYFCEYGSDCDGVEWDTYSNSFTSDIKYLQGYYIIREDGQGSVIQIIKK